MGVPTDSQRPKAQERQSQTFVQAVAAAVSTHRLYHPQHPSCLLALENVVGAMEPFFSEADTLCLELESQEQGLLLNGDAVTRPPGLAWKMHGFK